MREISKSRTLHGLTWSLFERVGQQGVQFFISIILARLLLPAEFGMIAMLIVFISLAHAILDSGFGSALIQKQEVKPIYESSIFYFNIVFGIVVAGLFALTAPLIAAFYEISQLTPIIRWMSLSLIINSFGVVQTALLTKRVDFKTQMKASIIATIVSGAVGIILASEGFGVWSLVVQSISANLIRTVVLWILSDWRPLWSFSFEALEEMFPFGSRILITSLINTVFYNIHYLIIGKLFSPADLGYYSRAQSTQQLPSQHILASTVARVVFPLFASLQDDLIRLKRILRRSISALALVTFPLMIGIAFTARPMVIVLLTEKWLPSVQYLQLLCLVGSFFPLQQVALNCINAQGRSDLTFRIEILTKILILITISITFRFGIKAMIYGQVVTAVIAYMIAAIYLQKLLNYKIIEQLQDLIPSLLIALIMGGVIYSIGFVGIQSKVLLLIFQVVAGIISFSSLAYVFKLSSFEELNQLIRSRSDQS